MRIDSRKGKITGLINPDGTMGGTALGMTLAQVTASKRGGFYTPAGDTIVAIGDSLQANGILIGAEPKFKQTSALNWTLALLGQDIWLPFGCTASWTSGPADIINYSLAVSGTTSQEAIDTQIKAAALFKAGWWSVQTGTNDLTLLPTDTVLQICNRLRTICEAGLAAGAKILLWTIPPRDNSAWGAYSSAFTTAGTTVTAQRLKHMAVNGWLRRYAQETPGIVLADPYNELVDPASSTDDWIAAYTSDGTHWNNTGCFIAGLCGSQALRPFVKRVRHSNIGQADIFNSTSNIGGNLALYSGLQGSASASGTGMSGTVPTGWTVGMQTGAATAACTVQARTDYLAPGVLSNGRELQVAISGVTGNSQFRAYQTAMSVFVPANTPFYTEAEISVSANSGAWNGPALQAFFTINTPSPNAVAMDSDGAPLPVGALFDVVLRTPIGMSSAAAGNYLFTQLNLLSGSALTAKIRRVSIKSLDPNLPGLLLGQA
jgi:lysophospholipase L1-like esterase